MSALGGRGSTWAPSPPGPSPWVTLAMPPLELLGFLHLNLHHPCPATAPWLPSSSLGLLPPRTRKWLSRLFWFILPLMLDPSFLVFSEKLFTNLPTLNAHHISLKATGAPPFPIFYSSPSTSPNTGDMEMQTLQGL